MPVFGEDPVHLADLHYLSAPGLENCHLVPVMGLVERDVAAGKGVRASPHRTYGVELRPVQGKTVLDTSAGFDMEVVKSSAEDTPLAAGTGKTVVEVAHKVAEEMEPGERRRRPLQSVDYSLAVAVAVEWQTGHSRVEVVIPTGQRSLVPGTLLVLDLGCEKEAGCMRHSSEAPRTVVDTVDMLENRLAARMSRSNVTSVSCDIPDCSVMEFGRGWPQVWPLHCCPHLPALQQAWLLCVQQGASSSLKPILAWVSLAHCPRPNLVSTGHRRPPAVQLALDGSWRELSGYAAARYLPGFLPCQKSRCLALLG